MVLPSPLVTRSEEVMSGAVVFTGTRVPVQTLIDYLEEGGRLDEFLVVEGVPRGAWPLTRQSRPQQPCKNGGSIVAQFCLCRGVACYAPTGTLRKPLWGGQGPCQKGPLS